MSVSKIAKSGEGTMKWKNKEMVGKPTTSSSKIKKHEQKPLT
jgi:hypothetical protein